MKRAKYIAGFVVSAIIAIIGALVAGKALVSMALLMLPALFASISSMLLFIIF